MLKIYKTHAASKSRTGVPAETGTKSVSLTCLTAMCLDFFSVGV